MSKTLIKNLAIIGLFFGVLFSGLWITKGGSKIPGPEFERAIVLYEQALSQSFDTASTGPEFDPALEAFKEVPWTDPKYSLAQTFIAEIEEGRALNADDSVTVVRQPIMIYTSKGCGYCAKAMNWMKGKNLEFVEIDVGTNKAALNGLRDKAERQNVSLRGVPIIEVDSELMQGFSPQRLEASLKAHGYLRAI